jgi:hypothetical protein
VCFQPFLVILLFLSLYRRKRIVVERCRMKRAGGGWVLRRHCSEEVLFCGTGSLQSAYKNHSLFNVFRARALHYTKTIPYLMCSVSVLYIIQKTLITNKCTKSFFINCNTLLHVSTLLGHLQGEFPVVFTIKVALCS